MKRACAGVIESAGGRYVEAAVMTPIAPKRIASPMLLGGPHAAEFHAEVGREASARGVDVLVTVGPLSNETAAAFDGEVHSVADAGEAAALVPDLVAPGDTVLVKASRGIGLEVVANALAGAEASA